MKTDRELLNMLLEAIDYSFWNQIEGKYEVELTYPVIDKVNYIKRVLRERPVSVMYKLSIVEKAKRYDEAIKKLRSLHDNYDTVSTLIDIKEELENIFPELAESEDEKVKKAILGMVYDSDNELWSSYDVSKSDVLAWLEKHSQVKEIPISQYENKTCKENEDSLTSEDERIRKEIIDFVKSRGGFKGDWITWLEKQCELKFKVGDVVRSSNGASILIVGITDYCYNCVTCATNDEYSFGFDIQDEFELVEQKSAEWSEQDKENLYHIDALIKDSSLEVRRQEYLSNWLKSLKDRCTWKPSDKQLEALKEACDEHWEPDGLDPLYTLCQELKKTI